MKLSSNIFSMCAALSLFFCITAMSVWVHSKRTHNLGYWGGRYAEGWTNICWQYGIDISAGGIFLRRGETKIRASTQAAFETYSRTSGPPSNGAWGFTTPVNYPIINWPGAAHPIRGSGFDVAYDRHSGSGTFSPPPIFSAESIGVVIPCWSLVVLFATLPASWALRNRRYLKRLVSFQPRPAAAFPIGLAPSKQLGSRNP